MELPFFYINEYTAGQKTITLHEDTSRHMIQVLRMKKGDKLHLADGKGNLLTTHITDDHKKHCQVEVEDSVFTAASPHKISIGISLLKNTNRFEWFLEKATEIGITEIIPLLCEHTVKEKFRYERLQQICISAMLQSQQVWLPVLHQPLPFALLFRLSEIPGWENKFIAHCEETDHKLPLSTYQPIKQSTILLIGPEGDFSSAEIQLSLAHKFVPVSLGRTRLRTETAGVVAATLLGI
ncbi:MAG TPA: RsmE family RNA methyltransferase [Chitinophagaceae bacterium]|nr:RsmE family RNA methyltransferase [Chitinophagaceae bacterium]